MVKRESKGQILRENVDNFMQSCSVHLYRLLAVAQLKVNETKTKQMLLFQYGHLSLINV